MSVLTLQVTALQRLRYGPNLRPELGLLQSELVVLLWLGTSGDVDPIFQRLEQDKILN